MATIIELHNLVTNNETKQSSSDRITGAEVRAVDNAIIDELARRGITTLIDPDWTVALPLVSKSETQNVFIPGIAIYSIIESAEIPDMIFTFPSPDAGWIWRRSSNEVLSVNGFTGNLSLTTAEIPEGANNFYFSAQKAQNAISVNEGVLKNFETGVIEFGEESAGADNAPLVGLAQLSTGREIQLNGKLILFRGVNGHVCFQDNPSKSVVDISSTFGFHQLRLRQSYTPTGTADANGATGDIAWDADFIYVKTATGWKRSALSAF